VTQHSRLLVAAAGGAAAWRQATMLQWLPLLVLQGVAQRRLAVAMKAPKPVLQVLSLQARQQVAVEAT